MDPRDVSRQNEEVLLAKVGRLMVLPQSETPDIATVADPATLQGQPFFADARKGDFVLIYRRAAEAILYDPAQDKIVNETSVTVGGSSAASSSAQ